MIEINNLTAVSVNQSFLKKIAKAVLEKEKIKKEVELSIALVGPARIKQINKIYRRKNRITDVLSFPESKTQLEKFKIEPLQKSQSLGEIVICLREVKKNAKRYKSDFETELARVLIHGTLHLLGYNHEKSEKEAKKMEEKQNYYLSQLLTS